MKKPYLLSIGISIPFFGIYGHQYFAVRRKYKFRHIRRLGFSIIWVSYHRIDEVP